MTCGDTLLLESMSGAYGYALQYKLNEVKIGEIISRVAKAQVYKRTEYTQLSTDIQCSAKEILEDQWRWGNFKHCGLIAKSGLFGNSSVEKSKSTFNFSAICSW